LASIAFGQKISGIFRQKAGFLGRTSGKPDTPQTVTRRADERRRDRISVANDPAISAGHRSGASMTTDPQSVLSYSEATVLLARHSWEDVSMRTKETGTDPQPTQRERLIYACARNLSREVRAFAHRQPGVLSTTSGPVVVAAVFCLVFLVMGTAFSFSTFASQLGHELNAGSGSISFIFGCAMALLYGGGLFSGALADRIGTHRVAGAGALLAGVSLAAAGAVGKVWQADVALGLGFGLGLAVCYTPAVAAVQLWFDRNRGVASGIALSGTGLGTLLMPLLARWLIDSQGWRVALAVMGLVVAGFGFMASNWIRRPPGLPTTPSSRRSRGLLRKLAREPRFRQLYVAGFLSSLVLLVPVVHMIPHAVRAGVAPRDAAWLISILGFGSLAGRLVLGHAADRLGRQRTLGVLHVALGMLFLVWTIKVAFVTLALFAFAYGVCYGATIALRPAVIADHFAGPNLAAVTGLHYTSSVLGPLVGPMAFGYSVDFWNSDLIASCVAAVCLVAAGYFFAAKPPRIPLRRMSSCRPRSSRTKMPGLTSFSNGRPLAMPNA
jgi:MFS transporter, OFA family, oxalate/formate antiporter